MILQKTMTSGTLFGGSKSSVITSLGLMLPPHRWYTEALTMSLPRSRSKETQYIEVSADDKAADAVCGGVRVQLFI